jgi:leucyl-tRNA synthetase
VLANEQVVDGRGWRSGALVEKREIPGYYLRITQYAEELLQHVKDGLPGWPERVKAMQENWIGKSAGVRFAFTHDIRGDDGALVQDGRLYVFTTRADTLMGVTFCAVAPEHPLATLAAARDAKVAAFVEACKQGGTTEAELATKDKEGVPTGLNVTHPVTGAAVPVWVGNYVLMSYGDGAVMGVPAHDERDFAFALKYGLRIEQVVAVQGQSFDATRWHEWYADKHSGRCVNSGFLDGLGHADAVDKVAGFLADKGLGEKRTTWRLRDWGISRQRYWGTPIPIIHCDGTPDQPGCGAVPVPEADLPVVLPEDLIPDGSGNPLSKCESFLKVKCPSCGKPARRETDTMDTFVDSSWYYMRYCDPKDAQHMVGSGTAYWMAGRGAAAGGAGMDQYIGGIEHAILHLLYARFWTKVMRDVGLVQVDEPFTRLLTQGMVLNHIYSRRTDKGGIEYFWPHEVENVFDEGGKIVGAKLKQAKGDLPAGTPITYEGVGTMSKSKNNGVDPQELIDRFGADTARLFVMFASPPEQTLEWNDAGVEGSHRFLKRVWALGAKHEALLKRATAGDLSGAALGAEAKALRREVHLVLKQVSYDYERMQYNTVVSGCMKLLNTLEAFEPASAEGAADAGSADGDAAALCEGVSVLLRALYPACPHITHGLWTGLGYAARQGELLDAPWPQVDEAALVQDEIELVLQIAGKMRGSIRVPAQANQAMIEAAALASPEFQRFAEGRAPRKVVVVPGRLVNVVV